MNWTFVKYLKSKLNQEKPMTALKKRYFIMLAFIIMFSIYWIGYNSLNAIHKKVIYLDIFIDDKIPLWNMAIIPYYLLFPYILFVVLYVIIKYPTMSIIMLKSYSICIGIAFLFYALFPTGIIRPMIPNNHGLNYFLNMLYSSDAPSNCFPSMHVVQAVLVTLYFIKTFIGKIVKILSITICLSIILSTVLVKQHYFLDVVAGLIVIYAVYYLENYRNISFASKKVLAKDS